MKRPIDRPLAVASGAGLAAAILLAPRPAFAMHLADGILPLRWAAAWWGLALPFLLGAFWLLARRAQRSPLYKPMVAMMAATVFLISCMPIPVPTAGTCSHPCGTGLAAVLIGPAMTVVVSFVALLLQALFLAHGGLTTLGADLCSMGIAGGLAGYLAWKMLRKLGAPLGVAGFAAGLASDWATYAITSVQLASALHGSQSFGALFRAVALAFVPTQLPLGLLEGAFTAAALAFLARRRPALLGLHAQRPAPAPPRAISSSLSPEASP